MAEPPASPQVTSTAGLELPHTMDSIEDLWESRKFSDLETLIRHHGHSNSISLNQTPLLSLICQEGPESLVRALLSAGSDPTAIDTRGHTPLHIACQNGRLNIVKLLWAKLLITTFRIRACPGPQNSCRSSNQCCATEEECLSDTSDQYSVMEEDCLSDTSEDRDMDELQSESCLEDIIINSSMRKEMELLNPRDNDGFTPLHLAFLNGHEHVVEYITHRLRAFYCSANDMTLLHLACLRTRSWWKRHKKMIELAFSRYGDVNAVDSTGYTALHYASQHGHLEAMEQLIAWGVDVNINGNHAVTSLRLACDSPYVWWKDQIAVVTLLLSNGASVNDGSSGSTPLHLASKHGFAKLVEYLLTQGALVDTRDCRPGMAPLHAASKEGHADIVNMLLSSGAIIDARDENKETALHHACERGHVEVIKILLAHGADVHAESKGCNPCTPLKHVVWEAPYPSKAESIKALLLSGANPLDSWQCPVGFSLDLVSLMLNFPLIILHQYLKMVCVHHRAHLGKPTVGLMARSGCVGQYWVFTVIKKMCRSELPWALCLLVLKKIPYKQPTPNTPVSKCRPPNSTTCYPRMPDYRKYRTCCG